MDKEKVTVGGTEEAKEKPFFKRVSINIKTNAKAIVIIISLGILGIITCIKLTEWEIISFGIAKAAGSALFIGIFFVIKDIITGRKKFNKKSNDEQR